ncbi:MAG: hypothetical protein WCK17_14140, partial [Verrucomicrobiota bacterium]
MLIAYWDIRNLRENIDLVADLLHREQPDLLVLQNIGNFDHRWTDVFSDYDDQRLFTPATIRTPEFLSEPTVLNAVTQFPDNTSTANHSSNERFGAGILLLAKNDVLSSGTCRILASVAPERRLLIQTPDANILVANLPSHGYTAQRHALRFVRENYVFRPPAKDTKEDIDVVLGNLALAPTDTDLHPALRTPNQPLSNSSVKRIDDMRLSTCARSRDLK